MYQKNNAIALRTKNVNWRQTLQIVLVCVVGVAMTGCLPASFSTNYTAPTELPPTIAAATPVRTVTPNVPPLAHVSVVDRTNTTSAKPAPVEPAFPLIVIWVKGLDQGLREKPLLTASVLVKVNRGSSLQLLEQSQDANWLRVKTGEGVTGWIHFSAVQLGPKVNAVAYMAVITPTRIAASETISKEKVVAIAPIPKRATATASATLSSSTLCDNSGWFFTPHPAETLRNFRITSITQQIFTSAILLHIHELGQTWVLFTSGGWTNQGGDIGVVSKLLSEQVGTPMSEAVTYNAHVGDTFIGSHVTAYVSRPDNEIVRWTIEEPSKHPLDWSVLKKTTFRTCHS
jgi:hypothetical protein